MQGDERNCHGAVEAVFEVLLHGVSRWVGGGGGGGGDRLGRKITPTPDVIE